MAAAETRLQGVSDSRSHIILITLTSANSLGPASIGPSRCEGMMRSKSQAVTTSAHLRTSSRRRGNANTWRIGGTNRGLAHSDGT